MAESTPEQQQEQYAAIELLYSEGKWSEAMEASEALLAALPPVQGHPLRPRLDLVIGHTLLYGLADPNAAEQRYRTVLVDTEEPVLREIAEQGLLRCNEARESVEEGELIAGAAPAALNTEAETALTNAATEAGPELTAPGADPVGAPFADVTAGPASGAAGVPWATAMPWETSGGQGTPGISEAGTSKSSAAMPWLAELGIEPPATGQGELQTAAFAEPDGAAPVANPAISDSVRTVRNVESTNLQALPLEAPPLEAAENASAAVASAEAAAFTGSQPASTSGTTPLSEATPSATAEETLALLREPDELIPVTVQVLDDTTPMPEAAAPEPAREEPPLSPDEMAELARGLLEVVLR